MITVEEADKIIFKDIKEFPPCRIPLQDAYGMVLQEDLIADRDFPPFHRATMDGIAIKFSSLGSGSRLFPIEGIQKANLSKGIRYIYSVSAPISQVIVHPRQVKQHLFR